MPYILPDGRKVNPDSAFLLGDVQYPPNYLKYSTELERQLLSIQWEDEQPEPQAEPVVQVPQAVTKLQARLALKQTGLLGTVILTMAGLGETDDARLYWEHAVTWERHSPVLLAFATSLGLTDEQVDQLFVTAAQL